MLDAFDELKPARADLERALALAESTSAVHQVVRSQLALSSVTASEGALEGAERLSTAAVRDALAAGLDTIAADGLIDLASTLARRNRTTEADATLQRALQLAEQRRAGRTAARARLQLASLRGEENRHREALKIVDSVLPFLKANRYRRYELAALSIASRAHERLDDLAQAQALSATVLQVADSLKDDGAVALAAANLASVTTALGQLPQALRLRESAEAIHRRQGNALSLPYDLANRAELLVRVGRASEAAVALAELDAGIAAGREAYVGRRRRVHMIRGLAEATALRCDHALGVLARVEADTAAADYSGIIGQAIAEFCRAHSGRSHSQTQVHAAGVEPALDRERRYWLGLAALHRNEPDAVVRNVNHALKSLGGVPNDELRWRLAALGVAATRQIEDKARRTAFVQLYVKALNGVRTGWKGEAPMYRKAT